MNDTARLIPEVSFNLCYLVFIWILVILMFRSRGPGEVSERRTGNLLRLAFLALAIGDTGHVGFRLVAYAMGSEEAAPVIFGVPFPLIGIGALLTSALVTVFYLLVAEAERRRFGSGWTWPYLILGVAGLVRFILMCFPGNRWGNAVPPADWSLYRNIPFTILGGGLAILMLVHAAREKDRLFTYLGILICISFGFYLPVILWVQKVPAIGMLMIPKTIAYLLMAIAVYRHYFRRTLS